VCKEKCKQIFIVVNYENINIKRTKQGYGTRSHLLLELNIINVIKGSTFTYTSLGDLVCGSFHEGLCID